MGESMTVVFDEAVVSREAIFSAVEGLGYGIAPYMESATRAKKPQANTLKKRFLISIFFLLPLMYCGMGGMIGLPVPPNEYNYVIQAALSLAVVVINFKILRVGDESAC